MIQFKNQKIKVQQLVKNAIDKYEENITNKIMNDHNKNKKLWLYIDVLRNKNRIKRTKVYDANGQKIEGDALNNGIKNFWEPLYQKHVNQIIDKYNSEEKEMYNYQFQNNEYDYGKYIKCIDIEGGIVNPIYETIKIPKQVSEHYDYCLGHGG